MQNENKSEESHDLFGDLATIYVAGFLSFLPQSFSFTGAEMINAHLCGLIVAVVSLVAVYRVIPHPEWPNLLIAVWLIVSPFAFHFDRPATLYYAVFGVLIAGIAASKLPILRAWPQHHLLSAGHH